MGRPRSKNNYNDYNIYVEILTKNTSFIVDMFDFEKVIKYKWHAKLAKSTNQYYFYSHYKGQKKLSLARYILDAKKDQIVDHINGDTLDNRRCNLRIVTKLQNNMNVKKRKNCKSQYKGVTLRPSGRWGVYIQATGRNICGGTFDSEIDAAKKYNELALTHFGEYARINKIEE